jgi:hypothetical protein
METMSLAMRGGDTAMQNTVEAKLSQQKIKECNDSLEAKNEIIGELKRNLDITNDVLEKHKLAKQIEEAEEEREQIVKTLMKLENDLRKLESEYAKELAREKRRELEQQARKHEGARSYKEAIEKWKMIYDLDPEVPHVEREIQRLDGMLQRTRQLDNYKQQLTLRIPEIKPICREVFQRLQEMSDTGQEDENVLFIVENFLQNRLAANDFIEAWGLLEQKSTRTSADEQPNYSILADRLNRGEIILFLGSDILRLSGLTELELENLTQGLAVKADYKNFSGSLSMIAQYYEMSDFGRSSLVRNFNTIIREKSLHEIKLYKMLAHIEQPLVLISATYDMFLENCFRAANKKYVMIASVICNRDNCKIDNATVNLKVGNVIIRYSDQKEARLLESGQDLSNLEDLNNYSLIYKILGYCESSAQGVWQDTWTITEENYFDFARNIGNSIPAYVVKQFLNRMVYFIGYSTKHWEDRLLVYIILHLSRYESARVITQVDDPFELAYWRWKKVDVYPVDLEDFVAQLEGYLS